jgi:hypothetical protein
MRARERERWAAEAGRGVGLREEAAREQKEFFLFFFLIFQNKFSNDFQIQI